MFSPIGAKRDMLRNLFRSQSSGEMISEIVRKEEKKNKRLSKSPSFERRKITRMDSTSVNHEELKKLMDYQNALGRALRKVAEAASHFNKNRDGIMIQAFETSSLDYFNFRILLKRVFFLDLSNEEFSHLCQLLDPMKSGDVNGSDFLVVFTLLAQIVKAKKKEANKQRARRLSLLEQQRRQELAAQLIEKEYANVDFKYSSEDAVVAKRKLHHAAEHYDRTHHSAKSLKAFECATLTPEAFRVLLKNTFSLELSDAELGAVVDMYRNGGSKDVNTTRFLVEFLRIGYERRMSKRSKQIELTRSASKELQQQHENKLAEQLNQLEMTPDENYDAEDEASAWQKLRLAAFHYDKNHPSAVSLQGFNATHLSPGLFRETLRRTFNISLTPKELAVVTRKFDSDKRGLINNHDFLVYFTRTGYEERTKFWSQQLEKNRREEAEKAAEEDRLLNEHWRRKDEQFNKLYSSERDYSSALAKITSVAKGYHPGHTSLQLDVFNGKIMGASEFQDMLRRCMDINLTFTEVHALIRLFGVRGKKGKFDSGVFLNKFKYIAAQERFRRRKIQLDLEKEREEQQKLEEEKIRLREIKENEEIIDFNFSEEDAASAFAKMSAAAAKFDRHHPSSMSLQGFEGLDMTPAYFHRMLKATFHVNLSGKELGAVVKKFDFDGNGRITSAEFLTSFFRLQREHRDKVRRERLQRIAKAEQEKMNYAMKKQEEQIKHEIKKLNYSPKDEESLLVKLKDVSKRFAVDNAAYLDQLQLFKGPAITAPAFRAAFYRIFLVKLTYKEVGALMTFLNPQLSSECLIDGNKFLTCFYKLSRLQEKVLLGVETDDYITWRMLRVEIDARTPSRSVSAVSRANSSAPKLLNDSIVSSDDDITEFFMNDPYEPATSLDTCSRGQKISVAVGTDELHVDTSSPTTVPTASYDASICSNDSASSSLFYPRSTTSSTSMISTLCNGCNPWTDWAELRSPMSMGSSRYSVKSQRGGGRSRSPSPVFLPRMK